VIIPVEFYVAAMLYQYPVVHRLEKESKPKLILCQAWVQPLHVATQAAAVVSMISVKRIAENCLQDKTAFTVVDDYSRMQILKQKLLPFVTLVSHLKEALTTTSILFRATEHAPIEIYASASPELAQKKA
jgi:hypothetical protein